MQRTCCLGRLPHALPGCVRRALRYLALLGGQKQLQDSLEQLDVCNVAAKAEELYELNPFRLPSPPSSP